MEDNLDILSNGRQPKSFVKLKILSIFGKWKTTPIFWQMEYELNILANGRQPQYFGKWKTTSIFSKKEDKLNMLANGR
jgi:hypothetical protein